MAVNRSGNVFAAEIGRWTVDMKGYTKRVWQLSVLQLAHIMNLPEGRGGNMPVRTGFLRSTLVASTSPIAIASAERPDDRGPYVYNPVAVERVVMGAKVGERLYIGYLADYVWAAEFGTRNYAGHAFQRLAVQRWDGIVQWAKNQARAGAAT